MSDQKPYLCPVCKGRQVISNEFYVGRSKTYAEERLSLDLSLVAQARAFNIRLEDGSLRRRSDETLPPGLTDEEKEEARILHSEVPCRTCDGKGMVIV